MIYAETGRQGAANVGLAVCKSTADGTRQMTVVKQQTYEHRHSLSTSSTVSQLVPYSIMSVGHRADPGFFAVSQQVTVKPGGKLPLLSIRPMVTFPAKEIISLDHYQLILLDDRVTQV